MTTNGATNGITRGKHGGARPGAGRPRGSIEAADLIALAREACPAAIKKAVALMDSEDENIRIKAIHCILDRGLGRPHQTTDITTQGDKIAIPQILVTVKPNGHDVAAFGATSQADVHPDK